MLMRWLLILFLMSPASSFAAEIVLFDASEPEATASSKIDAEASAADLAGQPTQPDGPLSPEELKLQGRWQAYAVDSEHKLWAFEFAGRTFTARAGEDDWYEGHIVIRNDSDPAQLDFAIADCLCGYKGMSSQAIYRWNGDALEVSAPTPGDPRPREFQALSGQMMRLLRSKP